MVVKLKPEIKRRIQDWIEGPFDEETKAEIQRLLAQDLNELEKAFFQDLSFGTGGMRGLMGIGTNRMNIYTVRMASQGLANHLKKQEGKKFSVFIGYDVRHHSRQFAEETARTLAANNIQVYISREICPTPLVSFACRHFGCSAAVMITASHNPPQYNGYKVYWSDGAQVVAPHDVGIIEEVHKVTNCLLASLDSSLIHWIGRELDAAYFLELKKLQLHPKISQNTLKIIYTNLHGTGIRIIPEALKQWGYHAVQLVEEQAAPNGDFPNAPSPNPEELKALQLGMNLLIKTKADLFLATDPDADRLGAAILHDGKAIPLTGNQIACLCLYHICSSLKEKKELPSNAAFVKTIVTTELFKKIVESFGCICIDVLTGFKYIAEKIHIWEESPRGLKYIFGAEESYGYLFGDFVRDKDAISSSCLLAEVAAQAKASGLTLLDQLYALYRKFGIHRETLFNLSFPDSPEGLEKAKILTQKLRSHPPLQIGKETITKIEDYSEGLQSLPKSDVLRFWLSDGSKLVIRPSGTEPKIKIYAEVMHQPTEEIESAIADADLRLKEMVSDFKKKLDI